MSTVFTGTRKLSQKDKEYLERVASDFILAGRNELGDIPRRWDRNEALYNNVPDSRGDFPFPKASNFHYPLVQTKVDALVAHVCTSISRVTPYFTALANGTQGERNSVIEQVVHYFWGLAGFEQKLRIVARLAAIFGEAYLYVGYKEIAQGFLADNDSPQVSYDIGARSYAGLDIRVIHPRDFVAYPNAAGSIQQAKLVGHRFLRRLSEIRDLIKAGRYDLIKSEDELMASSDWENTGQQLKTSDRVIHVQPPKPEDQMVTLWQVILRDRLPGDPHEKYYLITVEPISRKALSIQEYPFPRPWYFKIAFHEEYGRIRNSGSVAQNIQGIQVALNSIYNAIIDGAYMGVAPPTFVGGSGIGPQKSINYTPGEIIYVDGTIQPSQLKVQYDPSGLLAVANKLELAADLASRISNLAQATPLAGEQTATEVMRVWSGQQVGLAEYIQTLSLGLAEAAAFSLLLLRLYAQGGMGFAPEGNEEEAMLTSDAAGSEVLGWYSLHAQQIPASFMPQDLWSPVRFEVHGKSVAGAPEQRMAAAVNFAQLAMSNPIWIQSVDWLRLLRTIAQELQIPNADALILAPQPVAQPPMAPGGMPAPAGAPAAPAASPGPVDISGGGAPLQPFELGVS